MELTVRDAMQLGDLRRAKLVAGSDGLSNIVRHVSVIEVPDAYRWFKGYELFITAFYSLREDIEGQLRMIDELKRNNAAALAICYPELYMREIGQALVDRADELGLPVLELPNDVVYINIIDPVLQEIARRHKLALEYALRMNRLFTQMILRGAGVDELLRTLARELRAPVLVLDKHYKMLNAYDPGTSPPPACVTEYLMGRLDDRLSHILRVVKDFREPTRHFIQGVEGGRLGCIAMPIVIDNIYKGFLVAFEVVEQIHDTGLAAIDHACLGLSLIMMKQKAIGETELRMQGDLMDDIALNRYSEEVLLDRAARLGLSLSAKRIVLVATTDDEDDLHKVESGPHARDKIDHIYSVIRESLRHENPSNIVFLQGRQIVILPELENASDERSANARARSVGAFIHRRLASIPNIRRVQLGIGRHHQNLSGLALSYRQAKSAAVIGRYLFRDKPTVHIYEVESMDLFLSSLRADQAEAYVEATLGPLLEHDLKYDAELVRTLEACFLYGNQAQKTANALYIHRNTLSYRKQTIKKVLGMDPFLGYDQFRIQMALVLRRLLVGQLFHSTF